jgi:predicted lysophospholipase L1 biosynthesis ABC-type transport system permease subunit
MSLVRYWFLRSLRARARSYVGLAVLLALLGGLTLASFAGARRTASAYPRFREAGGALDLQMNSGGFEAEHPEVAGQMPGVTASATYMAFLAGPVTPDGRPDLSATGEVVGSLDGLYFTRDRFAVTKGRLPDPSRPDEVAVNEHMAAAGGVKVGDRVDIGIFDPAEEEAVYSDSPPPPVDRLDVTVVGIGLFPDEVVQDDTDRLPRMLFTPAFTTRNRDYASYAWTGVAVKGGQAGVDRFKRDYLAVLPPEAPAAFRETSTVVARTQEAVRPLAIALGVFGGLAAVATLLLVGQALVRLLRNDRDDIAVLRAMGAGPRLVTLLPVPGAAASVAAGVLGAVAVALALSPLAPIGPLRRVEVDPGVSIDATVLGLGAGGLVVVLGIIAVAAAARQAPHRRLLRARTEGARPSALVGAVSAAGLPLPAVAGMRLALESGGGRTAVPAKAALGGAVVAVIALVASLVFGSSLRSLVDEPRLYGWDWDLTVLDESGYGDIDVAKAAAVLDGDPAVAAWSGAFFQSVDLEGRDVPTLGVEAGAPVVPPILSGRPVQGHGEVVLGRRTLERLGKRIGDTVTLGADDQALPLQVVGTAVFPTVGAVLGAYTSLGEGAMLVYDQAPGWDEISSGPKALFIRLEPDADRASATERIEAGLFDVGHFPGSAELLPVQRPAEIVNYESMGATPALLGGVLVLSAVVSLGLTLASGVSRRRRDLSILKSLGFTRGQVSATVVWQSSIIVAVGLVVGLPLGIALGRWLWILFAERLPVLAQPAVPALALAGIACALVLLANLVATVPARVAGRTPVAAILRSE